MAYHDDLLIQAIELVHTKPPTQASQRRAVSTAYYAVFHLLIDEAISNWNNAQSRKSLARAFDHSIMKTASNRVSDRRLFPFTDEESTVANDLRHIARSFVQLQEDRHFADYNLSRDLELTGALSQVNTAAKVFATWPGIRETQIAQDYLASLLVRTR